MTDEFFRKWKKLFIDNQNGDKIKIRIIVIRFLNFTIFKSIRKLSRYLKLLTRSLTMELFT